MKQVFREKLAEWIHTHKSKESIHEIVPQNILPVNYGGEEKSLKQLSGKICFLVFFYYLRLK